MKQDVLAWTNGKPTDKLVTKETLNHRGLIEHFGQEGRFFIGGIATETLTFCTTEDVRHMVLDLAARAGAYPGFAMASGGGLHGNVPLQNLVAYLDARAEVDATPIDWRTCCRV